MKKVKCLFHALTPKVGMLKRAKSVDKKELMENAKKIEQIVSSILKDKHSHPIDRKI
jgi:hypothetical protein